jgi:hypothetical protein
MAMICLVCTITANKAANAQLLPEKMTQIEPKIPKRYFVHELSVYVSGGFSRMNCELDNGSGISSSGGVSAAAGFNYTYNFNGSIAIVTGLGFSTCSGKLSLSDYSGSYAGVDDQGDEFILDYSFHDVYRETQSIVLFTVPVMARYSTPLGRGQARYYLSGGLKLGLPVVARATITPGTVSTTGSYDYEDCTYYNLLEHGFVDGYADDRTKSNIRLNIMPLLSLETGIRIPLGYTTAMTMGVYLDYCPANIQHSADKHVLEYQSLSPAKFVYNSALNTNVVKKITLFNPGLKIGIIF